MSRYEVVCRSQSIIPAWGVQQDVNDHVASSFSTSFSLYFSLSISRLRVSWYKSIFLQRFSRLWCYRSNVYRFKANVDWWKINLRKKDVLPLLRERKEYKWDELNQDQVTFWEVLFLRRMDSLKHWWWRLLK